MHDIWQLFSAVARYCAALGLLIMILRFRQLSTAFRILAFVLANDLLTEIMSTWMFVRKINNMPLLHVYTLVSFWLFSLFFRELLRNKVFVRRYFWGYLITVSLLLVADSLWLESIYGFNSMAKTLVQLLFIAYVVYYLFDAFGKTDLLNARDLAVNLVNIAILIYNAGSLFIFMFAKTLNDGLLSSKAQSGLWMMNSLLYLIFQLLFLLAVWIQAFKATKFSS